MRLDSIDKQISVGRSVSDAIPDCPFPVTDDIVYGAIKTEEYAQGTNEMLVAGVLVLAVQ